MRMSSIVRNSSKLVSPFLVAYGAYMIVNGHITPGGGFQGGVILAVSVILLITSHGYKAVQETFSVRLVKSIESQSVLLIIIMSIIGLAFGSYFYNFLRGGEPGTLFSGGTVVIFNILIGLEVGAAFTLLFYMLLRWTEID
ncbi:MAG: MnhB domain-containing protein [Thermoplasmatota archaeon]